MCFFKCTIKTPWLRNKVSNGNHINYVESLKNCKQNCRQKDRHVYCVMIKWDVHTDMARHHVNIGKVAHLYGYSTQLTYSS